MKGFSRRNLYAIRQWYLFYSTLSAIVPQPVAQLPWGHNRLIVSKIKDYDEALWYALAANEYGWTRQDAHPDNDSRQRSCPQGHKGSKG
jgi:hypothetical protein